MFLELAKAMAKVEGFDASKDNRPTRNNNPGNIEYHDWLTQKYKVLGSDGRFAIFANVDEGYKAMVDILSGPGYRNLTIQQMITRWNGTNQSNNKHYCDLVCEFTGFKPTDIPSTEMQAKLVSQTKQATHNLGINTPEQKKVI